MRKLMKKKVKLFGRDVSVMLIAMVAVMGFAAAALVPFISNTVTGSATVSSPLSLEITAVSKGNFTNSPETFSAALYGGESLSSNSTLTVNSDSDVTGHLGEIRIPDFDGVGMEVVYEVLAPVQAGPWTIGGDNASPGLENRTCVKEEGEEMVTYFYIGDPSDILPAGLELEQRTTINTVLNLEPRAYTFESAAIVAEDNKCSLVFP